MFGPAVTRDEETGLELMIVDQPPEAGCPDTIETDARANSFDDLVTYLAALPVARGSRT